MLTANNCYFSGPAIFRGISLVTHLGSLGSARRQVEAAIKEAEAELAQTKLDLKQAQSDRELVVGSPTWGDSEIPH